MCRMNEINIAAHNNVGSAPHNTHNSSSEQIQILARQYRQRNA